MDAHELWLTAARASFVYVFFLVVIRLLGRREIGNFSAFDLIVALMLGEVVDEVIYGDVELTQFLVVVATVVVWDVANSWASFKSALVRRWTIGGPLVVVKNGKIQRRALARERLHEEDLLAQLRHFGLDRDQLEEIRSAAIETNGEVSILREDWAEPLRRRDLQGGGSPKRAKAG
jgi:uncharacterized membrane protein YcaP (DUF421 family)